MLAHVHGGRGHVGEQHQAQDDDEYILLSCNADTQCAELCGRTVSIAEDANCGHVWAGADGQDGVAHVKQLPHAGKGGDPTGNRVRSECVYRLPDNHAAGNTKAGANGVATLLDAPGAGPGYG